MIKLSIFITRIYFPEEVGYGAFTGQLYRFSRISTKAQDFVTYCVHRQLVTFLKGYAKKKLTLKFIQFKERQTIFQYLKRIMKTHFKTLFI